MDDATPMPGPVRTARILLWIDIVLMALAAVILFGLTMALVGQTRLDPTQLYVTVGWSAVVLAVTVFLTLKLTARRRWVRVGLIVVMAVNIVGYIVNLTSEGGLGFGAIVGLGLAVAVIVCLVQQESRAYLDQ